MPAKPIICRGGASHPRDTCISIPTFANQIVRVIDCRGYLPDETVILVGEADAIGYDDLQDRLGCLTAAAS